MYVWTDKRTVERAVPLSLSTPRSESGSRASAACKPHFAPLPSIACALRNHHHRDRRRHHHQHLRLLRDLGARERVTGRHCQLSATSAVGAWRGKAVRTTQIGAIGPPARRPLTSRPRFRAPSVSRLSLDLFMLVTHIRWRRNANRLPLFTRPHCPVSRRGQDLCLRQPTFLPTTVGSEAWP